MQKSSKAALCIGIVLKLGSKISSINFECLNIIYIL